MTKKRPLDDRIKKNSNVDEHGCWRWTGYKDRDGYGRIKVGGRPESSHRISYEQFVGPIPDGFQVDHLCRVRDCVNPAHLNAVTSRENTMALGSVAVAARNADKAVCPKGHSYSMLRGKRICRPCRAEASARYRARLASEG